jgi:hypothetical protein
MSGYGLDVRPIEFRSPAVAKGFSSNLCVQTGSEAHPASCPMDNGGHCPRVKARPERDADHSLHLVPSSRMSRNDNPLHPNASMACSGTSFLYLLLYSVPYSEPLLNMASGCFPMRQL